MRRLKWSRQIRAIRMKIATILAAIAMFFIVLMSLVDTSDGEYNRGYLEGYRQQQIESLPAIGVEKHKRVAAGLIGKG